MLKISSELLIIIFIPNTPYTMERSLSRRSDCRNFSLPTLTENTGISKEFGTRHRAAIGLSEVSDALTFVVSEETGGISITYNGVL